MKKDTRNYGKFHKRFAEGGFVGDSGYGPPPDSSIQPKFTADPNMSLLKGPGGYEGGYTAPEARYGPDSWSTAKQQARSKRRWAEGFVGLPEDYESAPSE